MVRQAQLILLFFYYRLHVSTYIQVIFRPFDIHKHFMYLRILSLWTWWDPNMHSLYGLSCQKAWRWPVCRSKHVACNKTTINQSCLTYHCSTLLEKIQVSLKLGRNNGTLHKNLWKFMITSRWILLRIRNVSDRCCRENPNINFMFNNFSRKSW